MIAEGLYSGICCLNERVDEANQGYYMPIVLPSVGLRIRSPILLIWLVLSDGRKSS